MQCLVATAPCWRCVTPKFSARLKQALGKATPSREED
ncbi:hypothetical protein ACVWY5_000720 [Bradyrhizobium sp. USDA 3256]